MRIAAAQLISTDDPAANLCLVAEHVRTAAQQEADLIVFPEATMCAFGNRLLPIAEPLDGSWAEQIRALAAEHRITVVAGMFTPSIEQTSTDQNSADQKVTNTLVATDGGVLVRYDKIHLYDAFSFAESDTVTPGADPVIITVAGVSVGLTTCYDIRFPGLYQTLADRGAGVIVVSASWGAGPGKIDQWQLLTRARALDSTSIVVAVDQADPSTRGHQTGTAPTGVGYSAVIGPDGRPIAELDAEPDLLITDVDPEQVARTRRQLPVLVNRRF